ncbi:hypothetical protein T07_8429 [Trichinella nelsoni]|uniref:Uncharacterized protein n=1 Tax=Trichinella nelsoni TaxID=6336 RepID=A0A0V0SK45_9BILA|nr:hypothetical protein T07_8429 [Trichinella nelsoni]
MKNPCKMTKLGNNCHISIYRCKTFAKTKPTKCANRGSNFALIKEKSCVNITHLVDGCKLCDETKWEHCDLLIFAMQSAVHLMLHSYLKGEGCIIHHHLQCLL